MTYRGYAIVKVARGWDIVCPDRGVIDNQPTPTDARSAIRLIHEFNYERG